MNLIRGIRGYFDLGLEGIRLLQGKKVVLSVTLNRVSAQELERLSAVAKEAGASVQYNILSESLPFLKDGDMAAMWPQQSKCEPSVHRANPGQYCFQLRKGTGPFLRRGLEESLGRGRFLLMAP
jgi:hypothetical protein